MSNWQSLAQIQRRVTFASHRTTVRALAHSVEFPLKFLTTMATTTIESQTTATGIEQIDSMPSSPSILSFSREQLDKDGLRLISQQAIILELWHANDSHSMSILELVKAFELEKKKNGVSRRYNFRQIIAEISYIRNDPVKGFTLVLKKRSYPTVRSD